MTRLGLGPFADPAVMQQLLGVTLGHPIAQGAGGLEAMLTAVLDSGQFKMPGNPLLDFAISNPRTMAELSRMPEYAPAVAQRALQIQMQPQRQVTAADIDWGRMTNEQLFRASSMGQQGMAQGAFKEVHRRGLAMGDLQKQYGGKR